jgi:hypothetical protein
VISGTIILGVGEKCDDEESEGEKKSNTDEGTVARISG